MLKEFKEFALNGSLIDIAVGFVMGAAFKEVVSSFTGGIISPVVGLIFKADLKTLKYILSPGTVGDGGIIEGESAIMWGQFVTHIIDFIIVAFVMFLVVKGVNSFKRKKEAAVTGPSNVQLLSEIRDLLKK
tara:strand:+ start:4777 stop:5169 length:393 start_codon:yes stop_codon:yes gene_type:complete